MAMTPEERREKARQQAREWRMRNPDKVRAARKRWKETHPEAVRQEKKEWYARHRNERRNYKRVQSATKKITKYARMVRGV